MADPSSSTPATRGAPLTLASDVEAIILRRRGADRRLFAKQYRTRWQQIARARWFTDEELAMLALLAAWLHPATNAVVDAGSQQVAPSEVCRLVGWRPRKAYRTLAALDAKNAVLVIPSTRVRNGGVWMNPELYFAGREPEATLRSMFLVRKNKALDSDPELEPKQPQLRPPTTLVFRVISGTGRRDECHI